MDLSGYALERLQEDVDFVLYRGRQEEGTRTILVRAPTLRKTEATAAERLEHELTLANDLDPAWSIRPLALGRHEGRKVLLLEDPGGRPLDRRPGKALDLARFLPVAIELAAAIRKVHASGLIHKDIKPANIFVDELGTVRLTGFGFATRLPRERQAPAPPEVIAGTLEYLAPEQSGRVNRSIDNRSDLYALGVTLYEMLVGALPFTATDPMEWIHCHIARLAPPPSVRVDGIPLPIEAIVLKLLEKNAEDRYQTAAGVEQDLRHCLTELRTRRRIEPFRLAQRDVSDRLLFPQKLYGRESELQALHDAFVQVSERGTFQLVLVSGYSGVGKTSVVSELHTAIHSARGFLAAGKFDQSKRDIPYSTLAVAFQGLLRQILGQDEETLVRWRTSLMQAVGSGGQLIVDLIPELSLIIGDQPAPPRLSAQEDRSRFQLVFQRFVRVFATVDHPLVLFLDDLQWLDAASLDLFERLATGDDIPYFLLIGAYRSNEIESLHDLGRTLDVIRDGRGDLKEFRLGPLAPKDVGQLLADALRVRDTSVGTLADLVFQKTQGNPFFIVQFLSALNLEGLLSVDPVAGGWHWDLDRIRTKGITDNVADLMAARLVRYDERARAIIKKFACLGNSATTSTLSKVLGIPEAEVDVALREFVSADLMHRVERGYAFAHDKVQEAAYALISDEERPSLHLSVGRVLAHGIDQKELEEGIFELVNQFNRGATRIGSDEERILLAQFNLIAGKRAKTATAYQSAWSYLATGRGLLPAESWEQQHQLTFELELQQADCKLMMGDMAFAEEQLATLARRSKDTSKLALVVGKQMVLYTYLGMTERALELSISCLAKLGMKLSIDPTDEEVEEEYRALIVLMGSRSAETLVELPIMSESRWIETVELLSEMLSPSGMLVSNLFDFLLLRIVNISLEHGHTHQSTHAYVSVGTRATWRFNNPDLGRLVDLARRLIDERGLDRYAARVFTVISGAAGPWSMPLADCYDYAVRSIDMPRERGGITYSGYAWVSGITALLGSGRALPEVQRIAETGLEFARKSQFRLVIEFITAQLLLISSLRGSITELSLRKFGDWNDTEYECSLEGPPQLSHAITRYRIRKLQFSFYWGHYAACLEILSKIDAERGDSHILCRSPVFEVVEYCFFSALSRAAILTEMTGPATVPLLAALQDGHAFLAEWAGRCPHNFADRACLVAAEIARLEGRELEAQRLYEKAIRLANDYGAIQNEALANELCARYYRARGVKVIADAYLRNAHSCYLRWGADGKAGQLERLYPELQADAGTRAVASVDGAQYRHLDLAAVVDMYQAVSREIVLERLIERLMVTVVEHAGAVRALLLLPRGNELRVVAEAATERETVNVTHQRDAETPGKLPRSVLNYVARSQDVIIINDALEANAYSEDPYIRKARPRSVLCLPLVKQKRLVGVLYLENNLSAHTFTPARLSVLQLLASQAAISIENANLFEDIRSAQEEARRVGDELRRSFDMIPALAWRTSADGAFEFANERWHDYTGISHEEASNGSWMRGFHPDDAEKVEDKWQHLVEFRTSGEFEARMRRRDGEYRSFLVRVTPLRDPQGRIIKWHGTHTDIENLKEMERAQEAFARVTRLTAMGELTVSIAHEVNQPLMAIVTNAAACLLWLSDEQLDIQKARRAAENVIRDGRHAGDVVASIRALARKSPPEPHKLELNEAILEVLLLTRNELDRSGIAVETDLGVDIGFAYADRIQMQQVVRNLVMNAIEAMAGCLNRTILIRTQRHDTGHILVSVADMGTGLGSTGAGQIFEIFFTTKPDGIGMGLSICRSIVEAYGGRLWAIPNTPQGTVFHFTVPIYVGRDLTDSIVQIPLGQGSLGA